MIDNQGKSNDNRDMDREVTKGFQIRIFNKTLRVCQGDLKAAAIFSALIDMRDLYFKPYGKNEVKASIQEIREHLGMSVSKPTVIKVLKDLSKAGLITRESSKPGKGTFTIHFDKIIEQDRIYRSKA